MEAAAAVVHDFDGVWKGRRVCPKQSHGHRLVISGGLVDMRAGVQGQPGFVRQRGKIEEGEALALTLKLYIRVFQRVITMRGTLRATGESLSGSLTFTHPKRKTPVSCQVDLARRAE